MLTDQAKWQETKADKERQFCTLMAFCGRFKLAGIQAQDGCAFDATIIQNRKPIAFAEIKYRNHRFGRYPDYTIDCRKLEDIWNETEAAGVDCYLIVSWQGDIRFAVLRRSDQYPVTEQLRRDRDELPDRVFHIPLARFSKI